jgi:hypothetical protein
MCIQKYQQCIQQASTIGKQQQDLQPFPFTVTYIMSTLTINHTDKSPRQTNQQYSTMPQQHSQQSAFDTTSPQT